MSDPTPPGQLGAYLIGDLGPARRNLQRIREGVLPPTGAIITEIQRSIEACIERIRRDLPAGTTAQERRP